ncbi:hypothetical protein Lbys_2439 [Leadbetterella byssophila DSM 17132]|uniref:Uncharacterized protein n=1 Tax=Leadbetterella byssophila (strain DSM 17132 / JCM 16389 / KACC 11308 / NBRC 106382 / 4M15) TaxID=649349 RepID=E4RXP1_LEAB4|nr:hypothetical protein Lbys_2439 [Leadbetterella byssophila DSM 17132]
MFVQDINQSKKNVGISGYLKLNYLNIWNKIN